MAHLLQAQSISLEYPTREVFAGLSVSLEQGDRIGVVGRNGEGKSTLLKLLAGVIRPDHGEVIARRGLRVGYVDQSDTVDADHSVLQAVVGDVADHEWAGDAKIRDVLAGVLGDIDYDSPLSALSGGQARRVSLAASLIHDWDVLMLDEPTNHLDIASVSWLARHLHSRFAKKDGALLVVTHDRWFLDQVTDQTWEVNRQQVSAYEGGYAAYVLQRMERARQAQASYAKSQNLLRKELAWLRRGPPARTTKPKFRIDAAESLIATEPPPRDQVSLTRLATQRLGKTVVDLEDVWAGYDGHDVIRGVTWNLAPGERTGIVAANGHGKTTLLRVLDGSLEPSRGKITRGKTVSIGSLDQRDGGLAPWWDKRVADLVAAHKTSYVAGKAEYTPSYLLEQLGFPSKDLSQPVSRLSGGQRRRLNILVQLLAEPNVLLLDEPTNDLDTDMLTALEDLLDSWPGTLIVVSHDRYLLERVTDHQYALIDGRLRHLPRGVDEYLQLIDSSSPPKPTTPQSTPRKGDGQLVIGSKEHRAAEKEHALIERQLAKLQATRDGLAVKMAEVDPQDWQALADVSDQARALNEEISQAETAWLEIGARLDDAR